MSSKKMQLAISRWHVFAYDSNHAGRVPMIVGLAILVPMLVIFILWASIAPLNSAAIANGEIVVSSDRKTVQHLEGGLVTKIYIKEGASVFQGQPLLVVKDLAEQARKQALSVQLINNDALIARLIAERDHLLVPDFSNIAIGIEADSEVIRQFTQTHLSIFLNLGNSIKSATELATSRKIQISQEIDGLKAQLAAKERESVLVRHEFEVKHSLQKRGISTETEVNALARAEAVLDGEIGALSASIGKLGQSSLDQDMEIFRIKNDRASAMLGELQLALVNSENMRQELRTLQDRQDRAIIRAPVAGVILGMQVHTIGAVVTPGTPLMDIVPKDEELIIEAKVNPTDVDLVSAGMPAQVQLLGFKANKVEKLNAIVETISGDIITDELSGQSYFLARLRVKEESLVRLPKGVLLSPGMPATVFLIAGERTLVNYMLSPITDAAFQAFREE